ncbi:hypothetical protein FEDK69T_19870 [Flavobacterium enshiense DK69]|uniref:Outer membrane protein beta-barrel domain-containing protein n=1 Tax=Flavobacterium enshiense DK69 TaxID=1107311 RepID=V6S917_9FLAO|nr:hypothetical protein [Flavobacterium enshiense]ESU22727.1 hypothetical protein FEDK69T_19870 [Flavobacterium enshiense DK69]KGO95577.1 hypothetical protein Q767_10120 [Flavobacterium enshiense DK69]
MKNHILFAFCLLITISANAQVFTNKEVGKKNQELIDSLKVTDYPYSLPIWGDKATKKGYNLPYSAGVSVNYLWQESDIIIDNLQVGFNNGPMYNLDQIVRFNKAVATSNTLSLRPDIWLFPFLNIYGIFGKTTASTDIGVGVWLDDPATGSETQITSFGTKVEFDATTFGLGMTPTIGVAGGFLALDMNVAWTDVPQLQKPAQTFIFGPRLGKNFKFGRPDQNIAVWVGGFRVQLKSETKGSLSLSEVFEGGDLKQKIDEGIAGVEQKRQDLETWWTNLGPAGQANPINQAKYNRADQILDRAGEFLTAADTAVNNISNSTVQYSMDKRPKDKWNFIIGSQYQYNKHWMLRGEVGFLSSRTQALLSLQYRFGL